MKKNFSFIFSLVLFLTIFQSSLLSSEEEVDNAKKHYDKGKEYYFLGDTKNLEKAEEEFEMSLEIDDSYLLAKIGIAEVYAVLGNKEGDEEKIKDALKMVKEVIAVNPNLAEAYRAKANIFRYLGILGEAKEFINRALELKSNDAESYWVLGSIYLEYIDYQIPDAKDKAMEYLKKAIEINPNLILAYVNLASVYIDKEDYRNCIYYSKKALEINPQNAFVHFDLGLCYSRIRKYDQAILEYENAIKIDPEYVSAMINVSILYYRHKENYVTSERYLRKVIDRYYDITSDYGLKISHYHLSKIYYFIGDCNSALREINEALYIDSHYEEANEWLDFLQKYCRR